MIKIREPEEPGLDDSVFVIECSMREKTAREMERAAR